MSLRARLVVAVTALLGLGLIISALATFAALRYFLLARTDTQLDQLGSMVPVDVLQLPARQGPGGGNGPGLRTGQPFVILQIRSPDGTVLRDLGSGDQRLPNVEVRPDNPTTARPDGAVYRSVSVPGAEPQEWRVRAAWLPDKQAVLLLGLPLTDFQATSDRLILAEATASAAVLLAITVLALRVIKIGLRPLDRIAEAASAIGTGDLDRRLGGYRPNTEIGRLTTALNAMLVQIQTAFRHRLASEERLRRFVADASHELNTPTATIRGYAELFRHGASGNPEELALAMRRIESEATRMGQLVNELLMLAKLDEGRPLETKPVDLTHLAAEAVADARAIEPERPIGIRAEEGVSMIGDEPRLRQLLTNLLANVRQHTPPGTPAEVRVSADDSYALIEVADEGPGIPPAFADRVFERFYRPGRTRSKGGGGSGLGLAIVAAIAAAHNGEARVRSAPGAGSTFVIRLSRTGPSPADAGPGAEPAGSEFGREAPGARSPIG